MTLQVSGPISARDINIEFGRDPGWSLPIGEAWVRAYAGISTGTISLSQFYGKSNYTPMTGYCYGATLEQSFFNQTNQFTGTTFPYASVSGGKGPFTYLWEFESNSSGWTLSDATSAGARVSHIVGKFGYQGSCFVRCTIRDQTGAVLVIRGIECNINVYDANQM